MITTNNTAKILMIKEQIIWEDACGLTIEFIVTDSEYTPFVIRFYGEILKFGNRELTFGKDGLNHGGGTILNSCPFPFD